MNKMKATKKEIKPATTELNDMVLISSCSATIKIFFSFFFLFLSLISVRLYTFSIENTGATEVNATHSCCLGNW